MPSLQHKYVPSLSVAVIIALLSSPGRFDASEACNGPDGFFCDDFETCNATSWSDSVGLSGDGFFLDSGQRLGNSNSFGVALRDFDGDGDLDAFVANTGEGGDGAPNKVWLNDCTGNFSDSGQALGNEPSFGVATAHINDDTHLDVFVANSHGRPNRVWLNDGQGNFSATPQDLGNSWSFSVALGDLDGDQDIDAYVANSTTGTPNPANKVWLGDGTGLFTDSGQELGTSGSQDVALGLLDADGYLDAMVVNGGNGKLWLNVGDGSGDFFESAQIPSGEESFDVALGDLDGDDDLDAFIANGALQGRPNIVFLNSGQGTFLESGQNIGSIPSDSVALGDLDGDGDLDAFVGNIEAPRSVNRVWLNEGNGHFVDNGQGNIDPRFTKDVQLGDLDGDGDLDAFVANTDGQNTVWINSSRPIDPENSTRP